VVRTWSCRRCLMEQLPAVVSVPCCRRLILAAASAFPSLPTAAGCLMYSASTRLNFLREGSEWWSEGFARVPERRSG